MVLFLLLAASPILASNTNVCLSLLAPTKGCFNANPSAACCTALKNFSAQKCFCAKLPNALLDTKDQSAIATAQAKCGVVNNCAGFGSRSYNGGVCPVIDEDLDFVRYGAAYAFSNEILQFRDRPGCFNYGNFRSFIGNYLQNNVIAYAGQGLGKYVGIDTVAEYFSLLSPVVNGNFLYLGLAPNPNPLLYISANGANVTVGVHVVNQYLNKYYQMNPTDYLETIFKFNGCDTKASEVFVPPVGTLTGTPTGVPKMARMLYLSANLMNGGFNNLGIRGLCVQAALFCTGANQQYTDRTECENFIKSLPPVSPKCGAAAILSGNTSACRAKHKYMVQINPNEHCPHIGNIR